MLATTWYRKKDWPRWLELDPEFQPSYDHWLKRMKGQIAALEKQGVLVEKGWLTPTNLSIGANFRVVTRQARRPGPRMLQCKASTRRSARGSSTGCPSPPL